ncbi:uncharacterized protein L969DRAFT_104547 [Mixia osmundae IAM 14324]|uniref:Tyrosine specific protein phosphatases domain-containing protein n=1 Tax=Mixia osmundae (strain CBS 9802 / IAM 14324 / JCM 22182 / KY 12970) TaxID=764103 RepID=G7DSL7_MIXOS|nr:uncharacterized protein L969DRAFT_104547 [Mixia osmundae IAM 14324]KEI37927.1 hypothetical protein L969DRAFT_104547 [Mixia osmundae IAM 14324]GAA93577.1 hypothetical protein E5Q_00221 [Mixia osmundae IAM 14324]
MLADAASGSSSVLSDHSARYYVPPLRFEQVAPQVYRGSHPKLKNLPFLATLRIRTVLSFTPDDPVLLSESKVDRRVKSWLGEQEARSEGEHVAPVAHRRWYKTDRMKTEIVTVNRSHVREACELMLDKRNHPVYLHCLDGVDVTSIVIACLRKVMMWNLDSVYSEMTRFLRLPPTTQSRQFVSDFLASPPASLGKSATNVPQLHLVLRGPSESATPLTIKADPVSRSGSTVAVQDVDSKSALSTKTKTSKDGGPLMVPERAYRPAWLWGGYATPAQYLTAAATVSDKTKETDQRDATPTPPLKRPSGSTTTHSGTSSDQSAPQPTPLTHFIGEASEVRTPIAAHYPDLANPDVVRSRGRQISSEADSLPQEASTPRANSRIPPYEEDRIFASAGASTQASVSTKDDRDQKRSAAIANLSTNAVLSRQLLYEPNGDDDAQEDDERTMPISQMIDALDLGI